MSVKLYKLDASPPARAAMMACEIYGVPVELIDVDLFRGGHRTPEYLKLNPLHTVPVLEDGSLALHDSHAIIMYLADAYGKSDSLYPKDVKQRALVNQKLFFDTSILFPRLRNVTYPALIEGVRTVSDKQRNDILEAYSYLEEFISRNKYLALDHITIADITAFATVTSLVHIVPIDSKKYPKTQAWLEELEKESFSKKCNAPGAAILGEFIKTKLDL